MTIKERNTYLTNRRWIVLIASCVANLCIGAIYAWSVFAGPMAEHLNAIHGTADSAASLAIIFSVANGVAFITMIAGGYFDEKIGSRLVILIGVVVFGLGFVVSGLARSKLVLAIGFSLMCGLANGFAYVCTVSNSVKFFPDKKGLAGGISTASFGISSVIIPPIANALNQTMGVCAAFIIFGVIIVILGVLCAMFIINCPSDFVPDGWLEGESRSALSCAENKTARQMLRSPFFYVMLGMLFVGCTLGLAMISEASNIAQTMIGMSVSSAALVVSVLALFNTAGRIVAGWVSDLIGRLNALTCVFVLFGMSLLLMYIAGGSKNSLLFTIGICIIGLCYGAFMGIYPGFTSDRFGIKYSSLNYGIMFIGFSAAGFAGPLMMSTIYNAQGNYRFGFIVAFFLTIIGLVLSLVNRRMDRKDA